MKRFYLKAFTLIELAIVLAIFGVLAGAVFKGMGVLENARLHSVRQDFEKYRHAIVSYQEQFQALPGDDAQMQTRFGLANGNGNGIIDEGDLQTFWPALYKAKLISSPDIPSSRLGGQFMPVYKPSEDMPGHWVRLAGSGGSGLFTPAQAQKLQASGSDLVIKEGEGAQAGQCVQNNILNLQVQRPVCVVFASF